MTRPAPLPAPRPVAAGPGAWGAIAVGVAAVRRRPDHASELTNQLFFGQAVRIARRTRDGKWLLARSEDGYRGWIRGWSVAAAAFAQVRAWRRAARLEVRAPWWTGAAPGVGPLPQGARLATGPGGALLGPCGPVGQWKAARTAVRPIPAPAGGSASATGRRVAQAARAWLGVSYLWGGRTYAGVDCSGLVQQAAARAGLALPRDARLQCARVGGPRRLWPLDRALAPRRGEGPRPGDLWFFGPRPGEVTHVAISRGGLALIHAYGRVCTASLDPAAPDFEPELFTSVLGWTRLPAGSRAPKFA